MIRRLRSGQALRVPSGLVRRAVFSLLALLFGLSLAWGQVASPRVVAPKFVAGGGSTTTWDATSIYNAALSGGNLTATGGATQGKFGNGLASASAASGQKRFWSVTVGTVQAGVTHNGVGLVDTNFWYSDGQYGTSLGSSSRALVYFNSGAVIYNGTTVATLATFTAGDVVDIAFQPGTAAWFRVNGGTWNNSGTADPATGTGGISLTSLSAPLYPAFEVYYDWDGTKTVQTANFGASSFPYTPPSGFSALP